MRCALPQEMNHRECALPKSTRPLIITGCRGTLGNAFARICAERGLPCLSFSRAELDVADGIQVERAFAGTNAWAVINTAGYVRVDDAENHREDCFRANALAPLVLAKYCARRELRLLTFSSDLVFDGSKRAPYLESDPVAPLGVYGQSKAEAERSVLEMSPDALVVRTSAFFGPWDEYNFVTLALRAFARNERWPAATDVIVSPTYVVDLAEVALDLLLGGERGVFHLANRGALSWAELARTAAEVAGFRAPPIDAQPALSLGLSAPRPSYSALGSERTDCMPPVEDALKRYVLEMRST
jgi:dTDP-4-dehydrorhamnose reductase